MDKQNVSCVGKEKCFSVSSPMYSVFMFQLNMLNDIHTVRFLWTRDRSVAEALYDKTQNRIETDILAPARFEPAIPGRERPQTHLRRRGVTGPAGR